MVDRKTVDYDRSLFFLVLSLVCIWLIVDNAVGAKYLNRFLSTLFPFMADGSVSTTDVESAENKETEDKNTETDDKEKNKNSSSIHNSTSNRTHGGSSITFN